MNGKPKKPKPPEPKLPDEYDDSWEDEVDG
jgi:hypothetical protein